MNPLRVALAFVVAALCPTVQIAASLHEAVVRHVVCAEHGELTHVSAVEATLPEGTAQDAVPSATGDHSSSEHEHCLQVGMVRNVRPQPALTASRAPEVLTRGLGEPAHYVAPGTRLLLCAPKTSPPSV
jgi:hypothetical protein